MEPKHWNYDLVIFDLDGTLLNTLEDLADGVNHALSCFGFPCRSLSEVRSFVGNGIGRLIHLSLPEGTEAATEERVLECFKEYYGLHSSDKTRAYDGVTEAVQELEDQGILTAVLSNKADFAVGPLCETYFPGHFSLTLGEREGIPRKPSPEGVWEIARQLQVPLERTVYVGDSEVDVETARRAGVDGIYVTWGFRSEAELLTAGATRLVAEPCELLSLS